MTRLVQIHRGSERRVALVEEPHLRLLEGVQSVYDLARKAIESEMTLPALVQEAATDELLAYDRIYHGESAWLLLPPVDHPEPSRCMVSGTGLTHVRSAINRNAMHELGTAEVTDSMQMFLWGLEGGKPGAGKIGIAPEWFFKGTGGILRAHGEVLETPWYAEDGGEEAEVAGVYLIDGEGRPRRIGMASGNEFADHRFEKGNYLNLAGSKVRNCALGPELVVDPEFQSVGGKVAIERDANVIWEREIRTGEDEMSHSVENIEHHHFKFDVHRRPWDIHVHYFGAHSLSFGDGIELASGDVMCIQFDGFGRTLRNPMQVSPKEGTLIKVRPL